MKSTTLPSKLSTLIEMFPQIFEGYKNAFYYDELSEFIMCNLHHLSPSEADQDIRFEEPELIKLCCIIDRQFEDRGYNVNFPKTTVYDAVIHFSHENSRNPRREWLEQLKWDGIPRVRTYFQRVIGAQIPFLSPQESEQYIGAVTVAWAMGSIARQYHPTQADVIPLLIGDQRIGKSNCLRFLAGRQEWYTDTTSDVTDPKIFLESIRGSAIVELSEATAIRSKESERTKSFISKREDTYRRPYERAVTTVYRRWVLIATSNLKTPFTDITGNMRYFPIYCEDKPTNVIKQFFADPHYAIREAEQFWAEAMVMYFEYHMSPNLSDEIKGMASRVQEFASKRNLAVEYLNDYLDNDPQYSKKGAFISRDEIFRIVCNSPVGSQEVYGNKQNFIFSWYNSKGCDWIEARPKVEDPMGQCSRPRGFVRQNDARPSYGVEYDVSYFVR